MWPFECEVRPKAPVAMMPGSLFMSNCALTTQAMLCHSCSLEFKQFMLWLAGAKQQPSLNFRHETPPVTAKSSA